MYGCLLNLHAANLSKTDFFLCVIDQNFQMKMGSCSIIFLDSAVRRRRAATARASRRRRTRGRQGDTFGFRVPARYGARWLEYTHRPPVSQRSSPSPGPASLRATARTRPSTTAWALGVAPLGCLARTGAPPPQPRLLPASAPRRSGQSNAAGDTCRVCPPLVSSLFFFDPLVSSLSARAQRCAHRARLGCSRRGSGRLSGSAW